MIFINIVSGNIYLVLSSAFDVNSGVFLHTGECDEAAPANPPLEHLDFVGGL